MKKMVLITSLLTSSLSFAGAISGGGGKSVVCRNSNGEITSAETLDLYEGRYLYGLQTLKTSYPVDFQIEKAIKNIPNSSRGIVSGYLNIVKNGVKFVSGQELQPIDDSFELMLPTGCKAEQVANYFNDNRIIVNYDIWKHFSNTDQAALIMHESIYASERLFGATSSQRTRHVVAKIFDPTVALVDINANVPQTALTCVSTTATFKAYKNNLNDWTMSFDRIADSQVFSQKLMSFLSHREINFGEAKNFPILADEEKIGTSFTFSGFAQSNFEDGDLVTIIKRWEKVVDYQGNTIQGYQTPRYYLSWKSGLYPKKEALESLVNCSLVINP